MNEQEQEHVTGDWVTVFNKGNVLADRCSVCGFCYYYGFKNKYKYCPMCGARLRKE